MPTADFAKMVPGFDFLQGLMKNAAGASLPGMSQWIAPTLDPEEIDKRISELRTVQFWLEQNAKLLGATIQALEVQRMTLATLKGMNLPMADLRESLKINLPKAAEPAPAPPPEPPARSKAPEPQAEKPASDEPAQPAGTVDPMQWWGSLTRQFTDLAANALKEGGPARQLAEAMVGAPAKGLAKAAGKSPAKRPAARKAGSKAPGKTLAAKKTARG